MKFHEITYTKGQQFILKYPKGLPKFNNSEVVLFQVEDVGSQHVHFIATTPDGQSQYIYSTRKTLDNRNSMVEVLWAKDPTIRYSEEFKEIDPDDELFTIT